MAPFNKWTTQLMLSIATTKLGVEKPCHDALKSVDRLSTTSGPSLSAISWGYNRMDIYGNDGKGNVTHQYWDGYQWGPAYNRIEALGGGFNSPPSAVASGTGVMHIFSVAQDKSLEHKQYDGKAWQPSITTFENLGGEFDDTFALAVTANGPNPLDIIGKSPDGSIIHKYYSGSAWEPQGDAEDLGFGNEFTYGVTAVAWGPNRLDIFAVYANLTLAHLYWDGTGNKWRDDWESLGDVELADTPTAISWGPGRLDVFGIDNESGSLLHTAWDGSQWLRDNFSTPAPGVQFTGTVAATSWSVNRIDVVVLGTDGNYYYKYWDGTAWQPQPPNNPYDMRPSPFISSPAVVSWGENRLDIYGIGNDSMLKHLTYYGSGWYPESGWETLGGPLSAF